jgi:hypothetical protein
VSITARGIIGGTAMAGLFAFLAVIIVKGTEHAMSAQRASSLYAGITGAQVPGRTSIIRLSTGTLSVMRNLDDTVSMTGESENNDFCSALIAALMTIDPATRLADKVAIQSEARDKTLAQFKIKDMLHSYQIEACQTLSLPKRWVIDIAPSGAPTS